MVASYPASGWSGVGVVASYPASGWSGGGGGTVEMTLSGCSQLVALTHSGEL